MKKIYLILAFICLCTIANADTSLPQTVTASLPKILLKNTVKSSEIATIKSSNEWGQNNKSNKFWTVYSDRANNQTYTGPSASSGEYKSLAFNAQVRIAKIQGDFALVYEEKEKGISYPHISTSAVSMGWIPMKNLLLWNSCPTNEVGIYNKALIVMNLDNISSSTKADMGKLYKNPATKSGQTTLRSSMNFFFVMKEADNGLVLLAKECKMEGYTYQVLYGWVSKDSYIPWNERTCLEPNWKPAVAEQMSGKTIPVYGNSSLSNIRCQFPLGRKNTVTTTRSTMYRMNPNEMRYPLLDNETGNKNIFKVTAFARPDGSAHVAPIPEDEGGTDIIDEGLKDKSIINLIVVIDGTSSMENYYPPTQEIIRRAYDFFGKENKTVKVGIVIYRDYSDGNFVTEHLSMRKPTDPSITSFLKNGGKYGIKSSPNDHTYAEALYKGLELALDNTTMGYSPKNSNLMIVIGDCGNDLNDHKCISDTEIIKRCVKNNIQLSAFQVRNNNEQSFLLFRQQMDKIVRENMKAQYARLGNGVKGRFAEISDGSGYNFKTNLPKDKNFYIGSTRNAQLGKNMDIAKLYDIVKNSYLQFSEAIDAQMGTIIRATETIAIHDGEDGGVTSTSVDMAYLKTIFSDKEIADLKKANSLMAFQGYTSQKTQDDNAYEYWKPIVYISSDEFASLMETLQKVMNAANEGSSDRKPYINSIKALVRAMVPDITEKEIDEKGYDEVMALISGLPVQTDQTKRIPIIKIADLPQVEFDGIIADFRNKYNKLKKIREQAYPFSIEHNKTRWYWIPVEDLP